VMDESYLTGEPYRMSKTPGAEVLSGAINGDTALTIRSTRLPADSRYARIMRVMEAAQQHRPRLRRLGDRLGAYYTPVAVLIAIVAWYFSGESIRFLAVLVIATPCPLILAIPVSIIASISLAARRGIVIRDPSVLERADTCQTMIFDKTGTLTYGQPQLTQQIVAPGFLAKEILELVSSLEQYSKHPLAEAILRAARSAGATIREASEISEPPGQGLRGIVNGRAVWVTNRARLLKQTPVNESELPPSGEGLECVIAIDRSYAATYRFRDEPRSESKSFIAHLRPKHLVTKVMLVSGDREAETRHLAQRVGVTKVYASKSPEEKVSIVREETARTRTLFLGDGINDAPALLAATVGVAFGQNSDITAEAAEAVILDASLAKVDEFLHIGRRMRRVALQSALGGMALSIFGMGLAAFGYLPPVAGAVTQEIIDVLAILNALRAGFFAGHLTDFD
jgi:heavy metal translocating P-type ATPase